MNPQETFVTRLRRYRERNRIPLDEIAAMTRIKRELLEAFERNDLAEWPRGVYARAWVRAYAAAVGLDPADTVDEFCRLFPQGDRRAGTVIQGVAAIIAHASEYRDEFPNGTDRRRAGDLAASERLPWYAPPARTINTVWVRCVAGMKAAYAPRLKRTPRTMG